MVQQWREASNTDITRFNQKLSEVYLSPFNFLNSYGAPLELAQNLRRPRPFDLMDMGRQRTVF
jgi:hypothetical protein